MGREGEKGSNCKWGGWSRPHLESHLWAKTWTQEGSEKKVPGWGNSECSAKAETGEACQHSEGQRGSGKLGRLDFTWTLALTKEIKGNGSVTVGF